MSSEGWEQRLADLGAAREAEGLRDAIVDTLVATVGAQMPRGKTWRPDPVADALLSGPLAPLLEAQAAVKRVRGVAADYDDGSEWGTIRHPGYVVRSAIRAALDGTP